MNKKYFLIFIICAFLMVVGIYGYLAYNNLKYPLKYSESIYNYSKEYNVKSEFIASVINAESGFDTNAISKKGAVGLMQLMPSTAKWLAEMLNISYSEDLLKNPDYNIKLGSYYLSYLSNKFSNTTEILSAYNAGEGIVRNWLNNKSYSNDGKTLTYIPYGQTRHYVQKVKDFIKIYQKKLNKN